MEQFNEDEELKKIQEKKQQISSELALTEKINNSVVDFYENSVASKKGEIQSLTNKLVNAEIEVKEKQIEGRKAVLKAEIEKEITKAKTEEDKEKHERAKTVLKAQGLTEKLPTAFRISALVVGYPFFLIYLLTLGWVIEFITFVIKGFITMVYDCADRFAQLNKKFIENGNDKQFQLGKAIFSILKWLIIVSAIIVIIILLSK